MRILAERDQLKGSADDARHSRKSGAERKHEDEQELHPVTEDRQHVAIVDPGANHHSDARAVQRKPHPDADEDRGGEYDEPHARILKKNRVAAGFDGNDDRGRHRTHQIVRRVDLDRIPAPDPDHQIGEDDRKAERDQRLAQILPFHAAKDEELHGDADYGAADKRDDVAQEPGAGPFGRLVAHVAAEQIERAVRKVDVAHEAEDQREAGSDEKVESAERDPVDQGVDEQPLSAEHVLETRGPGREDEPERKNDHDGDDERGDGVAPDPAGKRVAPSGARYCSVVAAESRSHLPPSRFSRKIPERRRRDMLDSLIFVRPYSLTTRAIVRYCVGATPTWAEKKWVKWLCDEKPSS